MLDASRSGRIGRRGERGRLFYRHTLPMQLPWMRCRAPGATHLTLFPPCPLLVLPTLLRDPFLVGANSPSPLGSIKRQTHTPYFYSDRNYHRVKKRIPSTYFFWLFWFQQINIIAYSRTFLYTGRDAGVTRSNRLKRSWRNLKALLAFSSAPRERFNGFHSLYTRGDTGGETSLVDGPDPWARAKVRGESQEGWCTSLQQHWLLSI